MSNIKQLVGSAPLITTLIMSGNIRRNDLRGDGDVTVTDESLAFKKPYQTVGRPPVVDNINDQYVRDPPQVYSRLHPKFCMLTAAS